MISMKSRPILPGLAMLLSVLLFAAGCQTSDVSLRDSGKSEAYITGFHDGRHSGMKEAGNYLEHMVKDTQRFDEDAGYRAGWLAGEQEGIRIQQQADAAVGAGDGYRITKDAEKLNEKEINKALEEATKNVDTDALKGLE